MVPAVMNSYKNMVVRYIFILKVLQIYFAKPPLKKSTEGAIQETVRRILKTITKGTHKKFNKNLMKIMSPGKKSLKYFRFGRLE
jgi:hypothetical protein